MSRSGRDRSEAWERADSGGGWLDRPLEWAVPLGRIAGIDLRLHLLLPLFAGVELLRASLGPSAMGLAPTAMALAWLAVSVLLHELGHAFACRRMGGHCDEILLWPLGGLAECDPPHDWLSHVVTAVGGPIVNLALLLGCGIALGIGGAPIAGAAIPNPLDPFAGLNLLGGSAWMEAVFLLGWVNSILLAINVVPMLPLDGGRIVEGVLRRRRGAHESLQIAIRVGYGAAIALAIAGILIDQLTLLVLAALGALWGHRLSQTLQRDLVGEESEGLPAGAFSSRGDSRSQREARRLEEAERREEERQRREAEAVAQRQQEVDRILAKIRREGMQSLNAAERKSLERETKRRRGEGEG
jgi:stage IV sporulation protein FB